MEENEVLVKINEETDSRYGKPPNERNTEELLRLGVVVIDKPCGPSSHEVGAWARNILGLKKAGHSGTLDPNVSGVLVVGLEDATKAMGFLLKSTKDYVGIMRFHRDISERNLLKEQMRICPEDKLRDVRKVFKKFTGEISQRPPVKSAIRRVVRKRKVYYLDALEVKERDVLFAVGCDAGTYIRKLCSDIGREIGGGANMLELRRTKVGGIGEERALTLQKLSDARWLWKEKGDDSLMRKIILPLEDVVDLKKVWLRDSAIESVCSGAQLAAPGVAKLQAGIAKGDGIALLSLKGELVALARAEMDSQEMLNSAHGIVANTVRVLMKKGTYPKSWKSKAQ
ncbi:MAG: RNA-guided pseudouridylation complex pseudouridine synthase subunit Cbf5 [Candidatus Micrarchaeota archaeon]